MNTEYRKPWVQRHWLLMLVLSLGVTIVLSLALGVGVMYAMMSTVKQTAPYREAMERVRADPRMTQALGEPIETRWIPLGAVEQREHGQAQLVVFLRGPRGEGAVDVQGVFEGGIWRYRRLEGQVDGPPKERFDLRKDVDR